MDTHQKKDKFIKKLFLSNSWFWVKSITILVFFIYFIVINIIQPDNFLKWTWHWGIWLPFTTYIVVWEGRKYFRIYKNLLKKIMNMDTLVGLAAHILFLYSVIQVANNTTSPMYSYTVMWEGTAALIIITNIGHHLEFQLQSMATETYKQLDEIRTSKVMVLRNNHEVLVNVNEIKVGELMIIKKGSLVPVDGKIMSDGVFDYSNITGESQKVKLSKNKTVISGSFNIGEMVMVVVEKNFRNSTISIIIDKIEELSLAKPNLQKFADKILKYFVPAVFTISFLTFLTWLIIGYLWNVHVSWINISGTWNTAITAGVTVLAIACPCAFGIATPLIYTVSSIISIKSGISINNTPALETIGKIKYFAFDKTGTITTNNMCVSSIQGNKKYLPIAKGLEQSIDHPIAAAIRNISSLTSTISKIKSIEGIGVFGVWNNKKVSIRKSSNQNIQNPQTTISLYLENKEVIIFEIENTIKESAKKTIQLLKNKNIIPIMITGDNKIISDHIAKKVGIDIVYCNISPLEKSKLILELQKKGKVAFAGDGFNDSIAMKQADISVAFVSGSDITNSLADVSILNNNFYSIYKVYQISTMNKKVVLIALTWAFLFNILAIPLAISLFIVPWIGATLMAGSNILISLTSYIYKVVGIKKIVHKK